MRPTRGFRVHLPTVKRPYASVVILMATVTTCLLMSYHPAIPMQKVAFDLASILVGGFTVKTSVAIATGAHKVAVLMVACVLAMFVCAFLFDDHQVFSGFTLENAAQAVGGGDRDNRWRVLAATDRTG